MSKRHMLDGEDIAHSLYEAMLDYDDDVIVTVHPMRRDSKCAPLVAYMYKDGSELVEDPLYCYLCWIEKKYQKHIDTDEAYAIGIGDTRSHLIDALDAMWFMERDQ